MFPTEAFETRTKRQVLRVLAETNRSYTIDDLAEACHRSRSTISRAVSDGDRYPFIERSTAAGSKQHLYALDTDSEYAEPIRRLFEIERRRERRGGTVPVHVWNLLEILTDRIEASTESFVELFLFGSYATGEYYAGSDIDLLLVTTGSEQSERTRAHNVIDAVDPSKEVQLLVQSVSESVETEEVPTVVESQVQAFQRQSAIPLSGRVRT
jgi:predicted nucleotidyltransferase